MKWRDWLAAVRTDRKALAGLAIVGSFGVVAVIGPACVGELDAIFATKPLGEWAAIFDATEDFWWAPVQTPQELLNDPQAHAAGCFWDVPDEGGTTLLPTTPADFHGTPTEARWMAPDPGQHTDEVLGELGRDAEQISKLRSAGVVA